MASGVLPDAASVRFRSGPLGDVLEYLVTGEVVQLPVHSMQQFFSSIEEVFFYQ